MPIPTTITQANSITQSLTSIPAYDDILDTVGKNVSMNLSLNDAIGLIPFMTSIQTVDTLQLKGSDYQPGKVYYFQLDQENLNEIKQEPALSLWLRTF